MKVKAHVFVSGSVQGVFFRSETRREAKENRITGWVRNLADGRVEAVFEGEEEKVKELTDFCMRGPRGARVTAVEILWEPYSAEFKDFEVRYQ